MLNLQFQNEFFNIPRFRHLSLGFYNPEKGSKSENFARGRCKNVYFLLIFSDFEEKSSARLMYMLSALNSKIQSISSKDHQKIIKISSKYQCILLAESAKKALAKMPNFEGHSMRAPYNGFFGLGGYLGLFFKVLIFEF